MYFMHFLTNFEPWAILILMKSCSKNSWPFSFTLVLLDLPFVMLESISNVLMAQSLGALHFYII